MKISGIYQIQSKIKPDRIYIGSAANIYNRKKSHLCDLRHNKHPNLKLQRHYNKYGEADLQFSILLGCDRNELVKKEQFFIDLYLPFFNNRKIANSNIGMIHSDETRLKISQGNMGRVQSQETRRKISEGHKGKIISEATRKKYSLVNLGKKLSEETKRKISESNKGKNTWSKGKKLSKEVCMKMSESRKGEKNPFFGKHHTEEVKMKMRRHKTIEIIKE